MQFCLFLHNNYVIDDMSSNYLYIYIYIKFLDYTFKCSKLYLKINFVFAIKNVENNQKQFLAFFIR